MEYQEREKEIRRLHEALRGGDSVPEDECVRLVEAYSNSLATSAESAAYHLFWAIAPICALRPEVEERLLEIPVWALMNHLYDNGELAAGWLRHNLAAEGEKAFMRPGPDGLAWLAALSGQPERLQMVFDRIERETTEQNTRELLDDLAPDSALPRERIHIRWELTEEVLAETAALVLFFLSPRDEENHAAFRALTAVLARVDPEGALRLLVLDLPPYLRPAEFRHPEMADRWFDIGQAEPQTYWVWRGHPIGSVGRGVTDEEAYASGVAELLRA